MRIYQLSRELGRSSAELLRIAKALDINAHSNLSSLTRADVDKLRNEALATTPDPQQPSSQFSLKAVLAFSGMVMVPTGLTALLGEAIGLLPRQSALVSLGVAFLVAVTLSRRWLDARLSSSLVTGFAIVLATAAGWRILVFDSAAQRAGLSGYEMRSEGDRLAPIIAGYIDDSRESLWFCGTTFYVTVSQFDFEDKLLAKLHAGVDIHFLIIDPDSVFYAEAARMAQITPAEMLPGTHITIRALLRLKRRLEADTHNTGRRGRLEVWLYDAMPTARIYCADPKTPAAQMLFVPYFGNANSTTLPAFEFRGYSHALEAYFSKVQLLRAGRPLDEWLKAHPEFEQQSD